LPDFNLRGGKVDRSSADGALAEALKARRGVGCDAARGCPPPRWERGLERGLDPLPIKFFIKPI